jgi:leader peptidase (prepilin peptidase)/N-methyltransferase
MGLGDVKMMAMLGATLGWEPLFPLLLLASITGALVGVIVMTRTKEGMQQLALPFGVFLGIAFLVVLFFGQGLMDWYVRLLLI